MRTWFYEKETDIDFAEVTDVAAIKEIVLHHCRISNFSCLTAAKALKSIFLVDCNVTSEDLRCLKELEKLKTIGLNVMTLDSLLCLTEITSLRELRLRKLSGINYEDLENFKKLQTLSIQEAELDNLDFLNQLKNLKELEFNEVEIASLNFLYNLPKLKTFTMRYCAKDETALACISDMKNLQSFQYPVGDMRIYQACPKLNSIGIDASRVTGLEALKGNETINNVMFYHLQTEKQYEKLLEEANTYLHLTSYGYVGEIDAE